MNRDDTETIDLIVQVRSGNPGAWSQLVNKEVPPLKRYAKGRLPTWARSAGDTHDIVQNVLLRTLPRLGTWQNQGRGALRAFLRKAVVNQIVDEIRKARKRMGSSLLLETLSDPAPSPLARVIQDESVRTLREALAQLSKADRRLLAARFGSGYRYNEIARRLKRPSANAARIAVERAVERLSKIMHGVDAGHVSRGRSPKPRHAAVTAAAAPSRLRAQP